MMTLLFLCWINCFSVAIFLLLRYVTVIIIVNLMVSNEATDFVLLILLLVPLNLLMVATRYPLNIERTMQLGHGEMDVDNFWVCVLQEYPEISLLAICILSPFFTMYPGESAS